MTTSPAAPVDDCRLEGPCGFCATLTTSARAALAETLAADAASPTRLTEQPARPERLHRWDGAIREQASQLRSATLALNEAPAGAWRDACCDFLAIEIAKTVGLVVAAPAGALVIGAGDALTTARAALPRGRATEAVSR